HGGGPGSAAPAVVGGGGGGGGGAGDGAFSSACTAFRTRFTNTWCNKSGSPTISSGRGYALVKAIPFRLSSPSRNSATPSSTSATDRKSTRLNSSHDQI